MSGVFDVPPKERFPRIHDIETSDVGWGSCRLCTCGKGDWTQEVNSAFFAKCSGSFSIDMSVSGSVTSCLKDLSYNDPPFLIYRRKKKRMP